MRQKKLETPITLPLPVSMAEPVNPAAPRERRFRLRNVVLAMGLVISLSIPVCWYYRVPLLTSLAHAFEVNDSPQQADVIVVLGGGMNTRPFEAYKLYQQRYAKTILLAETRSTPANDLGIVLRETDASRDILLKLGASANDVVTFGSNVTSTYEEACALRDWLQQNKLTRIIIPTDFTHTRRVKWLMKHILPADTQITVVATSSLYYDQTNWWQREEGLISFQNEIIKNCYYRFRY